MLTKIGTNGLISNTIGAEGVPEVEIDRLRRQFPNPIQVLRNNREQFPVGWLEPGARFPDLKKSLEFARRFSEYEVLVVIGMGGSTLGTRALTAVFSNRIGQKSFELAGKKLVVLDNLDPSLLKEALDQASGRKVALNPVSKSGNTLEVISLFSILLNTLGERKVPVVVTTTVDKGTLFTFAEKRDLPVLDIPSDVGGRFSVLTNVSFFPLSFLGIETEEILQGAIDANQILMKDDYDENPALRLAGLMFLLYKLRNVDELFLLSYCEKLADFGDWWVQLVAESLGKRVKVDRGVEHIGITPVSSVCPSAQHSILQLLLEGPPNKAVNFVTVEDKSIQKPSATVHHLPPEFAEFRPILNRSICEIVDAEYAGTLGAIKDLRRPHSVIQLNNLRGTSLGEFIQFWQMFVALLGRFLGVNPFDQPSVELGKNIAWKKLQNL